MLREDMTGIIWNGCGIWHAISGSKKEQGDLLTIELAALLHDISDAKFNGGDEDERKQSGW